MNYFSGHRSPAFLLWICALLSLSSCKTADDFSDGDSEQTTDTDSANDQSTETIADTESADTSTESDEKKPNLILILSDDQGYADLYANLPEKLQGDPNYDEVKAATPNLDRLASAGVMFTDAHTNGNTCAPSRAGIMLGRYEQRTGLWNTPDSRVGLDLTETTLADVLKQGGYSTGMFGKWHLGLAPMYNPRERGFDVFYGFLGHGSHDYYDLTFEAPIGYNNMMRDYENIDEGKEQYVTDRIAEETINFIEQNATKPFFAYVCFNAVHTPMQPPTEGPFATDSTEPREQLMGMLGRMDLAIKNILDALTKHGIRENTLLAFMSDNGGATASNADNSPLKGNKGTMWEGGIRVPLIVSWPGTLRAGEKFDQMVMGFDLFPTFVAAAGLTMPDNGKVYDSRNLLPFLPKVAGETPAKEPVHESLFWDQNEGNFAVRLGIWKLVKEKDSIELYNMTTDHTEQNNLAAKRPDIVAELTKAHEDWRAEMKPQYESSSGCRDPRYAEYTEKEVRHNESLCETLIPKDGCRDPNAANFDYTVTNHLESLCQ